jgi:hypothetical protein
MTVGCCDRGDGEEEARPGWIVRGGVVPLFGATKWNDEKHIERWRGLGLRRLPIDDFAHNNQPKIGVQDGGEYEGEVRLGGSARRGCLSIILAALSSNNIMKLK